LNNTPTDPSPSFEDSLRELEATVERLEAGELPLEESLALFEKGVGSLKRCHAILDQAEKRIRVLVQGVDGAIGLRDVPAVSPSAERSGSSGPPLPRKKSGKQMVDGEALARHNVAPQAISEPKSGQDLPEQDPFQEPDEPGPGGSLFGVAK